MPIKLTDIEESVLTVYGKDSRAWRELLADVRKYHDIDWFDRTPAHGEIIGKWSELVNWPEVKLKQKASKSK